MKSGAMLASTEFKKICPCFSMNLRCSPSRAMAIFAVAALGLGIWLLRADKKSQFQPSVPSAPQSNRDAEDGSKKISRAEALAELKTKMKDHSDAMVRSAQAAASREPITTYESKLRPATVEVFQKSAESRFRRLFDSWGMSKQEAQEVIDAYVAKRISEIDVAISDTRSSATITDWRDGKQVKPHTQATRAMLASARDLGDAELLVILGQERFDQLMEVDRQVNEQNRKAAAAARE